MIRWILTLFCVLLVFCSASPVMAQVPIPDLTKAQIEQLNELRQQAFTATELGDFPAAESYWTQLIDLLPDNPVGWSNRGNSRVSQNKLKEAIADFNQSIELAPDAADPYLNRGTAYEGQGRWEDAIADYQKVLDINPNDAMGYNNLGNAKAGQGKWKEAIANYQKAAELAPNFAFARANYALALYQVGDKEKAIREMRNIIRKYPQFPDVRAALTAALWVDDKRGEAESHWAAAVGLDRRYKDIDWVENVRRWPPLMVAALEKFLTLN
ncbi:MULTISPECIES: tetratricopeptide repeat protein [unclassified Coleofasciculus]|uniref:tetratricopeptide repeat protein n=1 Tax=unclassified Coleofasciculus TaxID=2692782 RepID=UPI00188146D6|nr:MULTISPECIES: tetratricopeptide repeat protein [unclassified Coleofasciculus]MBE9126939.1 tetratricopeptide repeat protein [Coleofasciculus sp. LEGE 07081]MBE9148650.1 tetratricopeptide repeat protein [Coleofasciculus sp. LEGE 07092]